MVDKYLVHTCVQCSNICGVLQYHNTVLYCGTKLGMGIYAKMANIFFSQLYHLYSINQTVCNTGSISQTVCNTGIDNMNVQVSSCALVVIYYN